MLKVCSKSGNKPRRALGYRSRGFLGDSAGAALVEFAIMLPVLLLLLFGGVEIGRFVLLNQKLNRLSMNMGDLVSRSETISVAELTEIFKAPAFIITPFVLGPADAIVISSVARVGANPARVVWQQKGPGAATATSNVGNIGDLANMPAGFTLRDDQDVIVTEVFFAYTPMFLGMATPPANLYYFAVQKPRNGSLTDLEL